MKRNSHHDAWPMRFTRCPRCGANAFEILSHHSYCVDCNYCPSTDENFEPPLPDWALDALKDGWGSKNSKKNGVNQ